MCREHRRHQGPRTAFAAERFEGRRELLGASLASRRGEAEDAELGEPPPELPGQGRSRGARDRLGALLAAEARERVADRALPGVEIEIDAQDAGAQRARAAARACSGAPPSSSRSAWSRMLNTWSGCSRV